MTAIVIHNLGGSYMTARQGGIYSLETLDKGMSHIPVGTKWKGARALPASQDGT